MKNYLIMTMSYYLKPGYYIGPFFLSSYSLFLSIAFLACLFVAEKCAREKGIDRVYIIDLLIIVLLSSLFGSKLFGVFFEDFDYYRANPLRVLYIWQGGLVFYGGLIFGSIGGLAYTYYRRIEFSKIADIAGITIPLGLVFGRIGCLASGCCYGKISSWGINYHIVDKLAPQVLYFHPELAGINLIPTQAIEALVNLIFFFILYSLRKRCEGLILPLFGIFYSLFRFTIEFYRADYRGITFGTLSLSQIISIIVFVSSCIGIYSLKKQELPRPPAASTPSKEGE